jgi:GxxExxY protein
MAARLDAHAAPETHAILGALIEVHRELGPGYLEAVYQEAACIEFGLRGVPFEREKTLRIWYKGEELGVHYRADFICFGNVLVEFKAQVSMGGPEEAQMLNYLRATRLQVGLLVNFGDEKLRIRRFLMDETVSSVDSVSSVAGETQPQESSDPGSGPSS